MSEKLKPCPFCGQLDVIQLGVDTKGRVQCINEDCEHGYKNPMSVTAWNHRPIEDALNAEITRLTARVQELEGLLDKANACIGSVVACCTYGSEQSAKIGAYGISLDAFTKIDTYMRTISESNWLPLSQPPQEEL